MRQLCWSPTVLCIVVNILQNCTFWLCFCVTDDRCSHFVEYVAVFLSMTQITLRLVSATHRIRIELTKCSIFGYYMQVCDVMNMFITFEFLYIFFSYNLSAFCFFLRVRKKPSLFIEYSTKFRSFGVFGLSKCLKVAF